MELVITILKEVEISTIGVFGQLVHLSNRMEQQLVHLTANSVLKPYLFGKQSAKLFKNKIENMNLQFFYHMKSMEVDLEHYKVI